MDIEEPPDSKYKLIQVVDRGSLKWPSNCILEAIVTLWKVFSTIVNDADLHNSFISGLSRNILVGITTSIIENDHGEQWRVVCSMCGTLRWDILAKLPLSTSNCIISNKIKNMNALKTNQAGNARKLKKLKSD